MRPFLFVLSLLIVFWNSQVFSKTWIDYPPDLPDMTRMSEYDKANYWLNDRGEVNLAIYPNSPLDLVPLARSHVDISFGHIEGGRVVANASRAGFEEFLEYGFDYEVTTPEWLTGPVQMSDHAEYLAGTGPADWYTYPSYQAYVGFVEKFEDDYPEICKMYNLGQSGVDNMNHHIYALRISDNVAVNEAESRYLETNTIHGDEVLNLMNCLHMVDTILKSYVAGQSRFVKMVDSLEMWFLPNLNPDGTYPRGDNTVQYAQRRSVKDDFDLNRNNPCPCNVGNHELYGLYNYWSNETKALQLLHSWYKFPFAQDQHGGTETYLWPYGGIQTRPKDEDFYKWFTDYLVDQIHDDCNNNGYMTSCGGDGVGNIYNELYECHGIRCDMNDWAGNGISLTLESSHQKLLNENELEEKWLWCKEALLMSYEVCYQNGLHGIVTDSATGDPIFGVEVTRIGDTLTQWVNGMVLTDSCGRYVKYMNKGKHKFIFKKDGYQTKEIPNFDISSYTERYDLNVKLWDGTTGIENNTALNKNTIKITPLRNGIRINTGTLSKNALIGIYNVSGKLVTTLPASNAVWEGRDRSGKVVSNGCYIVRIKNGNQNLSKSFILNR